MGTLNYHISTGRRALQLLRSCMALSNMIQGATPGRAPVFPAREIDVFGLLSVRGSQSLAAVKLSLTIIIINQTHLILVVSSHIALLGCFRQRKNGFMEDSGMFGITRLFHCFGYVRHYSDISLLWVRSALLDCLSPEKWCR